MDLYNKYRARKITDLFPTSPIIQAAPTMIAKFLAGDRNAVPNAMLFYSETYGTGKTSLARLFPIEMNPSLTEQEKDEILSGENNQVCTTINGARFRGINDMASIDETIRYMKSSFFDINYFFIIDEAHKMTTDAQDLLLETIENLGNAPIYIILTSTQYAKNTDALLTRVQQYFFRSLFDSEIETLINDVAHKENIAVPPNIVKELAYLSKGSARDALSRLSKYIATNSVDDIIDDVTKEEAEIQTIINNFSAIANKQKNIPWSTIQTLLFGAMNKMRADAIREKLLQNIVSQLSSKKLKPTCSETAILFRQSMALLLNSLTTPISYPEKSQLSARLFMVYNDIKNLLGE